MKLKQLKLRNFRWYKSETIIDMSDLVAFIGKNDAWKSSILEALEIFFNSKLVTCDKNDKNIFTAWDDNNIDITCVFSDFPPEITIDAWNPTTFAEEYLLNDNGILEIKKSFSLSTKTPKEEVYIVCNHPSIENGDDLMFLKNADLKRRAEDLWIDAAIYNARINSSIRKWIWSHLDWLDLQKTDLPVNEQDSKKIYEKIKQYLPTFALFKSDRESTDEDNEVSNPMKIAVQNALSELQEEINNIKSRVEEKAVETANKTLEKLQEMSPELAKVLKPKFKAEPKFDSQFKLSIEWEWWIPINKRWSWVRRLILLNFFRAEAEKNRSTEQNIIYAFEEPETSQHPDYQRMLIDSFIKMVDSWNTQVILTTHTPALGWLLPLNCLRLVDIEWDERVITYWDDNVFRKVAETLWVLPDPLPKGAKGILLVEWKWDVFFVNHTSEKLKEWGFISSTFREKNIAIIPIWWCWNLKHWVTLNLVEQFWLPYWVLIDSDLWTNEERINRERITELNNNWVKAYATRKREPENYIHYDCVEVPEWTLLSFTETCDVKDIINTITWVKKDLVLETYWGNMDALKIRKVEEYIDDISWIKKYEFTEMFEDLLNIV